MEQLYSVPAVAKMMGCSNDTARMRMKDMPGVMNVGSSRRQQLMVPESGIRAWIANHRMPEPVKKMTVTISADGKMARIDRRTGKLRVG